MRILSWNINSVRLRERSLLRLLRAHEPDVVCLQETKVVDGLFPLRGLAKLGYRHHVLSGQKGYHGVGIVSRVALRASGTRTPCRHVYASFASGLELHNIYAPAGGDLPDPRHNPKFAAKLRFFRSLTRWFRDRQQPSAGAVLVGDLNVAPLPNDVWSHRQLVRVVTHTPVEVAALSGLRRSFDWLDAMRHFVPEPEKLYTWWSYRAADWKRVNKGRRLDHAWVTNPLHSALRSTEVLKRVRGWRLPSDHAPVKMDLSL